jgi:hypothetical protein
MADEVAAAAARLVVSIRAADMVLSRSRRIAEAVRRIMTLPLVSDGWLTGMPPGRSGFRRRARVCIW